VTFINYEVTSQKTESLTVGVWSGLGEQGG
jgi:hypothetical protein